MQYFPFHYSLWYIFSYYILCPILPSHSIPITVISPSRSSQTKSQRQLKISLSSQKRVTTMARYSTVLSQTLWSRVVIRQGQVEVVRVSMVRDLKTNFILSFRTRRVISLWLMRDQIPMAVSFSSSTLRKRHGSMASTVSSDKWSLAWKWSIRLPSYQRIMATDHLKKSRLQKQQSSNNLFKKRPPQWRSFFVLYN